MGTFYRTPYEYAHPAGNAVGGHLVATRRRRLYGQGATGACGTGACGTGACGTGA